MFPEKKHGGVHKNRVKHGFLMKLRSRNWNGSKMKSKPNKESN